MRRLTLLLALLATLCAPLFGADCVALSFTTLSTLTSHPVPYETWVADMRITDTQSPTLPVAVASWNRHFLLSPLVCVFSQIGGTRVVERTIDPDAGIPYLWVGEVPVEMQAQAGGPDNCHAAIALVHEDGITLIHTLNQGIVERRFYVEHLTWEQFVKRTYVIYEVVPSLPTMRIQWGKLPAEVTR